MSLIIGLTTTTTTCPEYVILPCGVVKDLNVQYSIPYLPDEFEVEYGFASEWPLNTTIVTIPGPSIPNPILIEDVDACEPIKVKLTPICDTIPGTSIEQTVAMPNIPTLKITPGECDPITGIQSFLIEKYNTTTAVSFHAILQVDGNIVWDDAGEITTVTSSYTNANPITDNTYSVTQDSTSGDGTGATFDITFVSNAITSVVITDGGEDYSIGDTIVINGTNFTGGATPGDNVTLTVTGRNCTRTCCTGAWVSAKLYEPLGGIDKNAVSPLVTNNTTPVAISISTTNQAFVGDSLVIYTQVVGYNTKKALSTITSKLVITEMNGTAITPNYEVPCSSCSVQSKSDDLTCLAPLPPIPTPGG
jgi:hypothetical protein